MSYKVLNGVEMLLSLKRWRLRIRSGQVDFLERYCGSRSAHRSILFIFVNATGSFTERSALDARWVSGFESFSQIRSAVGVGGRKVLRM